MSDVLDRCIFVIGRQRSGTTVLRDTLASHEEIVDLGEVMHPARKVGFYKILAQEIDARPDEIDHFSWFEILSLTLERLAKNHPKSAKFVVDIKYNMATSFGIEFSRNRASSILLDKLKQHSAMVIHIIRENKIALIVSERLAIQTNQWQITDESQRVLEKIHIGISDLGIVIQNEEYQDEFFSDGLRHAEKLVSVKYEEMFDENGDMDRATMTEVAAMAGITPDFELSPKLKKQGTSLDKVVSNYAALTETIDVLCNEGMISERNRSLF